MKVVAGTRQRRRHGVLLRIILLIAVIYAVFSLIQVRGEIHQNRRQLDQMAGQIEQLAETNAEWRQKADHPERYQEEKAREQGYAKPDETIVVVTPGNH
ncbi:MAG: septum formation initiator family protein [Clostridia bacterium]|nr:septum formation initiator family protein [Clostridia bacterium]